MNHDYRFSTDPIRVHKKIFKTLSSIFWWSGFQMRCSQTNRLPSIQIQSHEGHAWEEEYAYLHVISFQLRLCQSANVCHNSLMVWVPKHGLKRLCQLACQSVCCLRKRLTTHQTRNMVFFRCAKAPLCMAVSVGVSVGLLVTHMFDDPHGAPYWPTWPCLLQLQSY